jgi:hypothetical protein
MREQQMEDSQYDWDEEFVNREIMRGRLWGMGILVVCAMAALCVAGWLLLSPAKADSRPYVVSNDGGGLISDYVDKYNLLREVGAKVVIDGMCISACTAVLGLMPKEDVCATDYGRFGFHTASEGFAGAEFSASGTTIMWSLYPDDVVKKLAALGLTGKVAHPDIIMLPATDFVARCKADREAHS